VADTLNHITCGVIDVDTGYILVTGSRNEFLIRCFASRYLDNNGNCVWKKTYTNAINELWEGMDNIKDDSGFPYFSGTKKNTITGETGIFINTFDNTFDLDANFIVFEDNNWKQTLNQIYTDNFYYIVGQDYIEAEDRYSSMLVKMDQNGNPIWRKSYGSIVEGGGSILKNHENNLIIGGITGSFSPPLNNSKWYIIKTDTSGNLIWEKAFGHNSRSNGSVRDLIETQDSNILACGAYPAATWGTGGEQYDLDGCLRKIDNSGNLIWERFYKNYCKIESPDMIIMECELKSMIYKGEDLYILGNNRDHRGASRGFLQKVNESGEICWRRDYYAVDTNSTYQWLVSLKNTGDNGFIMAGYGNEYDRQGYYPPQQAWLVKTDSLGLDGLCNIEPDELNFDFEIQEVPEGICMNDTIEVYVHIAGKSAPYTIEFSTGQVIDSIYYPPTFVPVEIGLTDINLTWGGETYFEETITEATLSNHEWGQCIVKPVEFCTPHTSGTQEISITVTDAYGESKTITKEIFVNDNCGSGIADEVVNVVSLYPNPARDLLYIDVGDFDFAQSPGSMQVAERSRSNRFENAEVYNSAGQLIKTLQISNDLTVINVKDFISGVYQIKITDGDGNVLVRSFEKQ